MMNDLETLKYPIGKFIYESGPDQLASSVERIATLPEKLRQAAAVLTEDQLDKPYREGGWTLRQVIHHIADSHMNAYIRLKLAVTEKNPEIRPYDEAAWAECEEAKRGDIQLSLDLLEALHKRLVAFLRSLSPEQLRRTYYHPANGKRSEIAEVIAMYAWHGEHHLAHVTMATERKK